MLPVRKMVAIRSDRKERRSVEIHADLPDCGIGLVGVVWL